MSRAVAGRSAGSWIFQAVPGEFDIDGFIDRRPTRAKWRASARGIADAAGVGDRVFVWRAKGADPSDRSGVVAEAVVLGPVLVEADDSAARRFWRKAGSADSVEPRIEIEFTSFADGDGFVPRAELIDDPVMGASAIIKARAGSNFALSPEQDDRLSRLRAGGRRPWSRDDLIAALAHYPATDVAGLALAQGRYVSDARRTLASFRSCDPAHHRLGHRPKPHLLEVWSEVNGISAFPS